MKRISTILFAILGLAMASPARATHWYLAHWVWDTSGAEPTWRAPTGAVTAIDLRPIDAQGTAGGAASGFGFFGFPTTQTLDGAEAYFGSDLTANMSAAQRLSWRNKLSIGSALDNTRLIDVLAETLGSKSDPTQTARSRPVIPTSRGRIEIWLENAKAYDRDFAGAADAAWPNIQATEQANYRQVRTEQLALATAIDAAQQGDGSAASRLIVGYALDNHTNYTTAQATLSAAARAKYKRFLGGLVIKYSRWNLPRSNFIPNDLQDEGELAPETTITDSFNRADASNPPSNSSEGWAWTQINSLCQVKSNHLSDNAAGASTEVRADSDLSSADHYAQVLISAGGATNSGTGVGIRKDSTSTRTFYRTDVNGANVQRLFKRVAGTGTTLRTDAPTFSIPATVKVDASGSTISHYVGGTLTGSSTDTAITGNLRTVAIPGFGSGDTNQLDDFIAADLGGASPTPFIRPNMTGSMQPPRGGFQN